MKNDKLKQIIKEEVRKSLKEDSSSVDRAVKGLMHALYYAGADALEQFFDMTTREGRRDHLRAYSEFEEALACLRDYDFRFLGIKEK